MFASFDGAELAASSGPIAQVCGQEFCNNINSVSTASMAATNDTLPAIDNGQSLNLA